MTLRAARIILLFAAPAVLAAHADLDERIADLDRQIRETPNAAELYLKRGELYRIHRDWAACLADFRHALTLSPHLDAAHLARGRALHEAGLSQDALEDLLLYRELRPDHREGMLTSARALLGAGRPAEAAAEYDRAIAASKSATPEYYLERSRAYVAAGKPEQALAGLDQGVAALGPLVTLQGEAIRLEIQLGRTDQALVRLETIARWMTAERYRSQREEILGAGGTTTLAAEGSSR